MSKNHFWQCQLCGYQKWHLRTGTNDPENLPPKITERMPHEMQCPTCMEVTQRHPELYAWVTDVLTKHGVLGDD